MRKKKFEKLGITAVVMLTLAITACVPKNNPAVGKDDNLNQAELPSGSENGGTETKDTGSNTNTDTDLSNYEEYLGMNLAEMISGSYVSEDGTFCVSIYDFYNNLYAFGGETNDGNPDEIYSFWAMEIIPESPVDFADENSYSVNVGVKTFSVMSNLGQYWGSPVSGTISVEKNGITVEGKNGASLFNSGDGVLKLTRSDKAENFFAQKRALDFISDKNNGNIDNNLCGIWRQKDSDNPGFISFDENGNMAVYQKAGGTEVELSAGFFNTDEYGKIYAGLSNISSGTTESFTLGYDIKEDTMTLGVSDLAYFFNSDSDIVDFERVTEAEVPVVTLYEPDNVDAITHRGVARLADCERPIIPEFWAAENVENNGTGIVKVGGMIFFRCYDDEINKDMDTAEWGEFYARGLFDEAGCVGYYDTKTEECGIAYKDGCSGPLYYMNGKFYSDYSDYSVGDWCYPVGFYPDGSGRTDKKDSMTLASIRDVNEKCSRLCEYIYYDNTINIDDGTFYGNVIELGDDSHLYSEFIGDDFYYVTYNYSEPRIKIHEVSDSYSSDVVIADIETSGFAPSGYPMVSNMIIDSDAVYACVNWIDGTNEELQTTVVIRSEHKKAGSGKTVFTGMPDGMEASSKPYMLLNYDDEVIFTDYKESGEVTLSKQTSGDLIYVQGLGADLFSENFIETDPYSINNGKDATVLQDGELFGDILFAVTADCTYKASEDIGWRRVYEYKGFHYYLFWHDHDIELNPFAGVSQ